MYTTHLVKWLKNLMSLLKQLDAIAKMVNSNIVIEH